MVLRRAGEGHGLKACERQVSSVRQSIIDVRITMQGCRIVDFSHSVYNSKSTLSFIECAFAPELEAWPDDCDIIRSVWITKLGTCTEAGGL